MRTVIFDEPINGPSHSFLLRVPKAIILLFLMVSCFVLAFYLQVEPRPLITIILFLIACLSFNYIKKRSFRRIELNAFIIFGIIICVVLILGKHIVLSENTYAGKPSANYISPYSLIDLIALFAILPTLVILFLALYTRITCPKRKNRGVNSSSLQLGCINFATPKLKDIAITAIVPFLFWIPYLLAYWPGLIFGDTASSLAQNAGFIPYNNHFPVVYTLFIKTCFKISNLLGFGNTGGCVLYCLAQMAFMSACFSYLSQWITKRCNLKAIYAYLIVAVFAISPYIASYSVSFWKDPIFSTALVILSLLLFDFIASRGKVVAQSKTWIPLVAVLALIVMLFRNNGVYIIGLITVLMLGYSLLSRHRMRLLYSVLAGGSLAFTVVIYFIITGPVYTAFNVAPSEKAESLGIPLNQVSRVVALNGNMTESDRQYMNTIMPLEEYAEYYTPTCIDNLKWSPNFNNQVLNDGFYKHWISMFAQNPRAYFESWELQTFGFWAINQPQTWSYKNAQAGNVYNLSPQYCPVLIDQYDIHPDNKFGGDNLRNAFPKDSYSIPIGIILWAIVYIAICLALTGYARWIIALIPSLALLATLVIASPIWYWPRYGAAVQFMIPFYIAIVILLRKSIESRRQLNNRCHI